jgi:UPF0755 protein
LSIPKGFDLFQIGEVLQRANICLQDIFVRRAKDPLLARSLGIEGETLEGYLYPDQYKFPSMFGEENVILLMVDRFKTIYTQLARRAEQLGLTPREVVILASMIEKETDDEQDRRLISAVFHNRLRKGMPLQSDPTAIYGVKKTSAAITKNDLLRKSPYNTYLITGLPKGPIANPGLECLQAALYPAPVDYLFFVSKQDGTHHFSDTFEDHNRAVARYQRKAKRKIEDAAGALSARSNPICLPRRSDEGSLP